MTEGDALPAGSTLLLLDALVAAERSEAELPHVLLVSARTGDPLLLGPYDSGLHALVALQALDRAIGGAGVVELSVAPLHPPQDRG